MTLMETRSEFSACVVCEDNRRITWGYLLLKKFNPVFIISSDESRKLTPQLKKGEIIGKDELPNFFHVIFVHEADEKILDDLEIAWNYLFKFTSSGNPSVKEGELPIYRKNKTNGSQDLGVTDKDIEEAFAFITKQRDILPAMCLPTVNLDEKQEIKSAEQRQRVRNQWFSLLKIDRAQNVKDYEDMYSSLGGIKPIVYVIDDYNNYVDVCQEGIYEPKPDISPQDVAQYFLENAAEKYLLAKFEEIMRGFCLMLNNLSLLFTLKTPKIKLDLEQSGSDAIGDVLEFEVIKKDRSQIAAFIVDLEWIPPRAESSIDKPGSKMGHLGIDILSQIYPEIPCFIFTGLRHFEEMKEGLARGAYWGFNKEESHHYVNESAASQQMSEQLTSFSLKQHLTRAVNVRYSCYQELAFPHQLKIDPSIPAWQKLIDKLQIKLDDQCFQQQALKKLIAFLLPTATRVEPVKVLAAGKSQAQATFFVSPISQKDKLATRFIKIGPWFSIQKEYLAYKRVIQPRLNTYTANIIQKPILTEGDDGQMPWSALMYSLAGFPEDYNQLKSLNELFEQQMAAPPGDTFLLTCLQNTLLNVLLPLYQSGISQPVKPQPLWCWLGDVLPPLYTGVLIPLTMTSPDALDEKQATFAIASKAGPGIEDSEVWKNAKDLLKDLDFKLSEQRRDCIGYQDPSRINLETDNILKPPYKQILLCDWHLVDAQWAEKDSDPGKITLVHPDLGMRISLCGQSKDIRLRFGATWIRPGMSVNVLVCFDTQNQEFEKIKKKINEKFSSFNWVSQYRAKEDNFQLLLSNFQTVNQLPDRYLPSPFEIFGPGNEGPIAYNDTITARGGPIHGDLNLHNLLYAANETVGWLIDFESVKEAGMIAFDLAKLEVEIWNHHLSPYLIELAPLSPVSKGADLCYQLLCSCLQALSFSRNERDFFTVAMKKHLDKLDPDLEGLWEPIIQALKAIKTIRNFGLEKCHLQASELKWALAAYFFKAIKFESESKNFDNSYSGAAIFAFIASAWHLGDALGTMDPQKKRRSR